MIPFATADEGFVCPVINDQKIKPKPVLLQTESLFFPFRRQILVPLKHLVPLASSENRVGSSVDPKSERFDGVIHKTKVICNDVIQTDP